MHVTFEVCLETRIVVVVLSEIKYHENKLSEKSRTNTYAGIYIRWGNGGE